MEAIYFRSDTVEPTMIWTTSDGKIDFAALSVHFQLELGSIKLCGGVFPQRDQKSEALWKQIGALLGVGGSEQSPVMVSGRPKTEGIQRVVQYKSDGGHSIFVQTKMEFANRTCKAGLLFDTRFTEDLLLSEYKAEQLGLQKDTKRGGLFIAAGGKQLSFSYYGYLMVTLMVEDLYGYGTQVENPKRSSLLEVLAIAGTTSLEGYVVAPFPPNLVRTMDGEEVKAIEPTVSKTMSRLLKEKTPKIKVSPIKKGKVKFGYDAILGLPSMMRLGVGLDAQNKCLFPMEVEHCLL